MKHLRTAGWTFLIALALTSALAHLLVPASYAQQFRDTPDASCSRQHLLGTDDLGRDRLSRLLHGTRISLFLAPAAALIATLLAGIIGGAAGFAGGRLERCVMSATDLVLAMPWLFLLISVRALLPLNVAPVASVAITFALLGCLGWAGAARVICADARTMRRSDMLMRARATGCSELRLLSRHVLPNLRPVLLAQFLVSIPVFILTEANLGMLGLGVAEPMPSWGSLLRELGSCAGLSPRPLQFVPLMLLILTVGSFHVALGKKES